jgi:subtilisin family serine protease
VAALDALSEEEPDVMNLSLSGPPNELLGRAVGVVTERGSLIVAAVGNAGPSSPPLYPAAYPEVIAATAIDADFRIYRRAVRGEHVEFSAPGVRVWTAASLRGARPKTGTSYAAPFVTAAVALAVKSGALDRESAVERLTASVEDLGPVGRDNIYGFGLVKAADLCAPTPGEATVTTVATEADEGADAEAFSLAGE